MSRFSFSRYRGDTIRLQVACTRPDEDGVDEAIDITDATLTFTAKLNILDADDADTTIQVTTGSGITVLDAEAGLALVTIEPEATETLTKKTRYACDVQLDEDDGVRTTVAFGKLTILLDATRAGD